MKTKLVLTRFFQLVFVIFVAIGVFAQEKTITVITETQWDQNKVNVASMNNRINDAAEKYKEFAPIPRIAFYDIAYPKDKAEFEELKGYGLLLISSMSQNEAELPLKKVYSNIDGKEIELKLLKKILSKETKLESQVVKTFGLYRMDAIYLFPVYLETQETELLIDFAKNRNGMKIANFDGETIEVLKSLPNKKNLEQTPLDEPLQRFMKREYPGFFVN